MSQGYESYDPNYDLQPPPEEYDLNYDEKIRRFKRSRNSNSDKRRKKKKQSPTQARRKREMKIRSEQRRKASSKPPSSANIPNDLLFPTNGTISYKENLKRLSNIKKWALANNSDLRELDTYATISYSLKKRLRGPYANSLFEGINYITEQFSKVRVLATKFATAFVIDELSRGRDINVNITSQSFWYRCLTLNSTTGSQQSPGTLERNNGTFPTPVDFNTRLSQFSVHWQNLMPAAFAWPSRKNLAILSSQLAQQLKQNLAMHYERNTLERQVCLIPCFNPNNPP